MRLPQFRRPDLSLFAGGVEPNDSRGNVQLALALGGQI